MDTSHKNEQGQEHIRNAEKHLKTSLLKWRPDYDSAADEYDKAGLCLCVLRGAVSQGVGYSHLFPQLQELRAVQGVSFEGCRLSQAEQSVSFL
jgi:hypothetical protein